MVIRSETEADLHAITEVTIAAFNTLAISNHTEQFIIAALRDAKALAISLVAEVDGRCVHFGRNKELVRAGASFGAAGFSTAGRWQSPYQGRAVTIETNECSRMLPGRTSGLLQEIRLREYAGTRT